MPSFSTRAFLPSFAIVVSILAIANQPHAANWPQWRGPNLDGTSAETDLPLTWGPEQNVAWKLALPAGSGSTPVVWGDRVFLTLAENEKEGELFLWCVDGGDGKVLWRRSLGGGNEFLRKHDMASPSPVTDGKRVWVMTGTGIVRAFGLAGETLWTRDLQADYGKFGLQWGYASSPLLWDGALFIQVLHGMHTDDPSYLLRLHAGSWPARSNGVRGRES